MSLQIVRFTSLDDQAVSLPSRASSARSIRYVAVGGRSGVLAHVQLAEGLPNPLPGISETRAAFHAAGHARLGA